MVLSPQSKRVQDALGGEKVNFNLLVLPEVQFLCLLRNYSKSNQTLKAFMDLKKKKRSSLREKKFLLLTKKA